MTQAKDSPTRLEHIGGLGGIDVVANEWNDAENLVGKSRGKFKLPTQGIDIPPQCADLEVFALPDV